MGLCRKTSQLTNGLTITRSSDTLLLFSVLHDLDGITSSNSDVVLWKGDFRIHQRI
jgi:hypothetical protein